MSIRTSVAFAAMCLLSSAAIAQDATPPQEPVPVKEKVICRTVIATGTIMGKRICLTKTEWAKLNGAYDKQNETFRERQNQGGANAAQ
jgi:hypothetical protein